MQRSESIKELAAALAKAQKDMGAAKKGSTNPHFRSKYADLAAVVDAIKGPLAANGLAYIQAPCKNEKQEVGVETLLTHASGEWILGEPFFVPVEKANVQGLGSAVTYCRRYSLAAITGVAPDDDDDGNAACEPANKTGARDEAPEPQAVPYSAKERALLQELRDAAMEGTASLHAKWETIGKENRKRFEFELDGLKDAAAKAMPKAA